MKGNSSTNPGATAALLAVVVSITAGCGTIPTVLPPEARAKINETAVRSYIPQSEIGFQVMPSTYGAGMGLIGALVDAGVNSSMSSSAEERAKRLRAEVNDFDFRSAYWRAITNAVAECQWLNVQSFATIASDVHPMKAAMVTNCSAMTITTDYWISPNCRVLKVGCSLGVYLPGKHKKPAAAVLVSYYSSMIGTEEKDKALALWLANRGEAYRRAAAEGIEESAKMVRYALELMGGSYNGSSRPAKIKANLVHGRSDFGIPVGRAGLKGSVLEETETRLIFQMEGGGINSFPRKEVEVKFLPSK